MPCAEWYTDDPQAKVSSWLFILPEHGIAVELQGASRARAPTLGLLLTMPLCSVRWCCHIMGRPCGQAL